MAVYKFADNIDYWNGFAWTTYLWTYTSGLMRGMFEKIETFRIFKKVNPELKKVHKYTVAGFMLPFKIWILETFPETTRYYTLNHEESPPQQHSPQFVASPPRRKKYKSKTSSTKTTTNASTSQQPEVERTYMSSDTLTRSVKKKKTSTKELVKRLIGVVAYLTSKVHRVLQQKDEPDTRFGEEEDMVNEEEEEIYYHGTQLHYDDTSTHGLEEDVGRCNERGVLYDPIHTGIKENHQSKGGNQWSVLKKKMKTL
ncbi:unnamed protein product [Lactuca saligna]|uniref:Uncharacterized protein n=1 Tax=Lactuca saligna TaxID=75948 RepID=A0AA35ZM84_LACSI|nr:unnamed protein product [Lactuca saligna]